jgi:hypothetical protein
MPAKEKKKAEELKREDPKIAREIEKTAPGENAVSAEPAPQGKRPLASLGFYALLFIGVTVVY